MVTRPDITAHTVSAAGAAAASTSKGAAAPVKFLKRIQGTHESTLHERYIGAGCSEVSRSWELRLVSRVGRYLPRDATRSRDNILDLTYLTYLTYLTARYPQL